MSVMSEEDEKGRENLEVSALYVECDKHGDDAQQQDAYVFGDGR